MDRLYHRAKELISSEKPSLMAGDFNIIPQAEDAASPKNWVNDALFKLESRSKFRKILNLGFLDAFRACNDGPGHYSFWDYQAGAWNKNDGIRIDHFLLSPNCSDLLTDCKIDSDIRGREKPSDHVPIWIKLNV
jgi:exodeoxyribonuclease-3